jgi:dTDP-glucose 4,6-dehydratase
MSERVLLVTGGAGFIGSSFVIDTVESGFARVVTLDKLTYAGNLANLASLEGDPRHVFVQGDICDRALVEELFTKHRPSAVVHFAAESHVDRSIDGPSAFLTTNVVGTFTLLEATRAHLARQPDDGFRFVHVSTDEVFGSLDEGGYFVEDTPYDPRSPYSASKAATDDHDELLEQLRAAAVSGEAHSADAPELYRERALARLRLRLAGA